MVTSDGSTTWLDEGLSPPLYGGHPEGRTEAVTTLMAGNLLLCYTDGLVERRGESVDVGLRRLEEAASALSTSSPAKVCDRLIEQMGIGPATTDDVVVVALKLDSSHRSESLLPDRRAKSHT